MRVIFPLPASVAASPSAPHPHDQQPLAPPHYRHLQPPPPRLLPYFVLLLSLSTIASLLSCPVLTLDRQKLLFLDSRAGLLSLPRHLSFVLLWPFLVTLILVPSSRCGPIPPGTASGHHASAFQPPPREAHSPSFCRLRLSPRQRNILGAASRHLAFQPDCHRIRLFRPRSHPASPTLQPFAAEDDC